MRALPVFLIAGALLGLLVFGKAGARGDDARPLTVADDETLIQHLPGDGALMARERAALAAAPGNATLAVEMARQAIGRARAESDPRWLGRAQAVLRPWWDLASPPHDILVLRATIRQSNHEFGAALADLKTALAQDPADPQAWLTQAVLLQVRGDLEGARRSCEPLRRLVDDLVTATCVAGVDGLNGKAAPAARMLAAALERAGNADPDVRAWSLGLLGELQARLGETAEAERRFHQAMALAPRDSYVLAALADLLLDEGRPAEVVPLLAAETAVDNLLLRLAIAEKRTGVSTHAAEIAERYRSAHERGDRIHLREEARHALVMLDDPRQALARAVENWQVQHEPADVRILLEAAVAVGDPAAARPALEHVRATGLEDPAIRAAAGRLERP